jgi:hypothetical protein
MRPSLIVAASLGLVLSSCACEREDPAAEQAPEKETSSEDRLPRVQTDGGPEVGVPAHDMAGNFEGRAHVIVKRPEGPVDIKVISRDQRSRLQVDDAKHPERRLDLIFDDERAGVVFNDRKQYFDVNLDDLKEKPERATEVRQTSSSDDVRKVVHGLNCNPRELTQPGQKISACVLGLPNEFDAGSFQALTGIELPPWIEYLLERDLWPVTATVRDEAGKELYTVEVVDYTSRPLPAVEELSIPANFTRVEPRVPIRP